MREKTSRAVREYARDVHPAPKRLPSRSKERMLDAHVVARTWIRRVCLNNALQRGHKRMAGWLATSLPQTRKRRPEDGEANHIRRRAVRCSECAELAEEGAGGRLSRVLRRGEAAAAKAEPPDSRAWPMTSRAFPPLGSPSAPPAACSRGSGCPKDLLAPAPPPGKCWDR